MRILKAYRLLVAILILIIAQNTVAQSIVDSLRIDSLAVQTGSPITNSLAEAITTDQTITESDIQVSGKTITVGDKSVSVDALPALVKGGDGSVFQVKADGTKALVGKYDKEYANLPTSIDKSKASVTFDENPQARYDYDAWRKEYEDKPTLLRRYPKVCGRQVDNKAILPNETDPINFSLSGATQVVFVNSKGFVFNSQGNTLTLVGGPANDAQEIYAVANIDGKKTVIGALLLSAYAPKNTPVKLIPIADDSKLSATQLQEMQQRLNDIYSRVGVSYTITQDESLIGAPWCGGTGVCAAFKPTGSALLSNDYTDDEKKVIDYYSSLKAFNASDAQTAYIFLTGAQTGNTEGEESEGNLQGKMNFSKQFGFLYNIQSKKLDDALPRTLAHELAHGQYKLYHIFASMYLGDKAKTNDNLMSYSSSATATKLNKLQWDAIAKPGVVWGIMVADKEQQGARTTVNEDKKTVDFTAHVYLYSDIEKIIKILPFLRDVLKNNFDKDVKKNILRVTPIVLHIENDNKLYYLGEFNLIIELLNGDGRLTDKARELIETNKSTDNNYFYVFSSLMFKANTTCLNPGPIASNALGNNTGCLDIHDFFDNLKEDLNFQNNVYKENSSVTHLLHEIFHGCGYLYSPSQENLQNLTNIQIKEKLANGEINSHHVPNSTSNSSIYVYTLDDILVLNTSGDLLYTCYNEKGVPSGYSADIKNDGSNNNVKCYATFTDLSNKSLPVIVNKYGKLKLKKCVSVMSDPAINGELTQTFIMLDDFKNLNQSRPLPFNSLFGFPPCNFIYNANSYSDATGCIWKPNNIPVKYCIDRIENYIKAQEYNKDIDYFKINILILLLDFRIPNLILQNDQYPFASFCAS